MNAYKQEFANQVQVLDKVAIRGQWTLLAAKATRGAVTFEVEGCIEAHGQGYPEVRGLTWH